MPEIVKEILTVYWPQTVLIVASLGYLVKRIFDLRSKKIEQKHSLFQQNRMNAIMEFINCYLKLEHNYKMIQSGVISLNKISMTEVQELFSKRFTDLYSAYFFLKFYLEPLELARYSDLVSEMKNVCNKIYVIHNDLTVENASSLMSELNQFIANKIEMNNFNFKVISSVFRKYSNKHYSLK